MICFGWHDKYKMSSGTWRVGVQSTGWCKFGETLFWLNHRIIAIVFQASKPCLTNGFNQHQLHNLPKLLELDMRRLVGAELASNCGARRFLLSSSSMSSSFITNIVYSSSSSSDSYTLPVNLRQVNRTAEYMPCPGSLKACNFVKYSKYAPWY